MANVSCVKKSQLKKASAKFQASSHAAAAADPLLDMLIVDNEDLTFTVMGRSKAGNPIDISSVATLTPPPASSDPAIVTVDAPVGMGSAIHAVGPLSTPGSPVHISITATWNDPAAGLGPFSIDWPIDVVAGAAAGVTVVPGTPVLR